MAMNPNKIVVLSGAGVSADSGINTFRAADGLWESHRVEDVASPEGFAANHELVLRFYNERRRQIQQAKPNAAHMAIASLESHFEVVVITQNIDDLHERGGSSNVLHVHGEITKARSVYDDVTVFNIGYEDINLGDTCELGGQLRPHIVWFGEAVEHIDTALDHISDAGKVLVVGTSLNVFPVAGLVRYAHPNAEKVINALDLEAPPANYEYLQGKAAKVVPSLVQRWIAQ
ncbi:NAD-dependent deacylase [Salinibius halmophilus]|uniref:NAD-dependent deacylase n=1 Tax=Salinibius halmophilus TaxID=1853216 RepID=UPI000E673372|nr:NAD-dependent deacylase [Salinibius halmophilus]